MAKVLLVDDDPVIHIIAREYLCAMGYEVKLAENGSQALHLSNEDCPDIFILDMIMPDMSGLDVLEHLKADPARKNVPVIILSADIATAEQASKNKAQPNLFLQKPFKGKDLVQAITNLLAAG